MDATKERGGDHLGGSEIDEGVKLPQLKETSSPQRLKFFSKQSQKNKKLADGVTQLMNPNRMVAAVSRSLEISQSSKLRPRHDPSTTDSVFNPHTLTNRRGPPKSWETRVQKSILGEDWQIEKDRRAEISAYNMKSDRSRTISTL